MMIHVLLIEKLRNKLGPLKNNIMIAGTSLSSVKPGLQKIWWHSVTDLFINLGQGYGKYSLQAIYGQPCTLKISVICFQIH